MLKEIFAHACLFNRLIRLVNVFIHISVNVNRKIGFKNFVTHDWAKWRFEHFSFLFLYFTVSTAWNLLTQISSYAFEWMGDICSSSYPAFYQCPFYMEKSSGQAFDDSHHPLKFDIPTITNSCRSKKKFHVSAYIVRGVCRNLFLIPFLSLQTA